MCLRLPGLLLFVLNGLNDGTLVLEDDSAGAGGVKRNIFVEIMAATTANVYQESIAMTLVETVDKAFLDRVEAVVPPVGVACAVGGHEGGEAGQVWRVSLQPFFINHFG